MIRIRLEDARPGMKLSRAILNESGITVYGEGITLTGPLIQRIASMHIETICVEGRTAPGRPLQEEIDALDRRFSRTENVPYMSVLKRIVREHIESLYGPAR